MVWQHKAELAAKVEPERSHEAEVPPDAGAYSKSLAALAHELRTPLSAIVSLAEIMRDERLGPLSNPRYKTYAGDIHDCALHTLDLIAAMVTEARTGGGSDLPKPDLAMVDLDEVVRGCASAMEPVATRAGIALIAQPAPATLHVAADRRSLRQIVLNLLSNALRFTPAGGTVTLATVACAEGRVRLEVSDTGPGMRQQQIAATLAEPIGAGAAAQTPSDTGSGLGLPLVRRLAILHGAELDIVSDPGRGTRVSITFPSRRAVPA